MVDCEHRFREVTEPFHKAREYRCVHCGARRVETNMIDPMKVDMSFVAKLIRQREEERAIGL